MANEEQLAILKQGVPVWNGWRDENRVEIDLRDVNLSGIEFRGADFRKANLQHANFEDAELTFCQFDDANLSNANLAGVKLYSAVLYRANLSECELIDANLMQAGLEEANLRKAEISEVNFTGAVLTGCDFSESKMSDAIFGDVDLSEVKGLESIVHEGPSTIGIDTIAKSQGKIPETFLRGCGLPDWEIEGAKLHQLGLSNEEVSRILYRMYDLRATQAVQISPLFISYSRTDGEFVDKIGAALTQKGVRYWRDIHEMKAGRIEKQIDHAIKQNPTVLLILSEHSMQSDWVEHEVRRARALEKETGRDVLCPVALDDSWQRSPWPQRVMEQIMEYNVLDFSAWQDDRKFDGMFRKLIDGLELFYKG